MLNLIIKNGKIIDGSGCKAYFADVGILDGKIVKIGSISEDAEKVINAEGLAVARVEDYANGRCEGFPPSNMLRFVMEDGSFVAVRPSGTEPKCKYYYCVCGHTREQALQKLAAMRRTFER